MGTACSFSARRWEVTTTSDPAADGSLAAGAAAAVAATVCAKAGDKTAREAGMKAVHAKSRRACGEAVLTPKGSCSPCARSLIVFPSD
jgi:hypothetical protein